MANIGFSRVVILESLEPREVKTGEILNNYLKGLLQEYKLETRVDYFPFESANELKELIRRVIEDIPQYGKVVLHIECHGDILDGLLLSNGSELSWDELAAEIVPLNIATEFNLTLSIAACFSAHFLGKMDGLTTCPCRLLVAPSEEVNPADCMAGFRVFYESILRTRDLEASIKGIESIKLERGQWYGEYADRWFVKIATAYIKNECNSIELDRRARRIYRGLKAAGRSANVGAIRRGMRKKIVEEQIPDMYETFFGIKEFPERRDMFLHSLKLVYRYIELERDRGRGGL